MLVDSRPIFPRNEIDQISIRSKRIRGFRGWRKGRGGARLRTRTLSPRVSHGWQAGWPTHGFLEDAARIENRGDRVLGPLRDSGRVLSLSLSLPPTWQKI